MSATPPVVAVDVETSIRGVIEIALVRLEAGKVTRTLSSLVRPPNWEPRLTDLLTNVSGIQPDDLISAPSFGELAPALATVSRGALLAAHNAHVERRALAVEYARLGLPAPEVQLDTLALARKCWPGRRSYSLARLCADLGIPHAGPHRALADAWACASLFALLCASGAVAK